MRFIYLLSCQRTKAQASLCIFEERRLRLACANVQAHQSICCSHTQSMDVDEDSEQNVDL